MEQSTITSPVALTPTPQDKIDRFIQKFSIESYPIDALGFWYKNSLQTKYFDYDDIVHFRDVFKDVITNYTNLEYKGIVQINTIGNDSHINVLKASSKPDSKLPQFSIVFFAYASKRDNECGIVVVFYAEKSPEQMKLKEMLKIYKPAILPRLGNSVETYIKTKEDKNKNQNSGPGVLNKFSSLFNKKPIATSTSQTIVGFGKRKTRRHRSRKLKKTRKH